MKFTQFLFPNGRRQEIIIEMPKDVEALASELVAAGYRFEIECFSTGMVHMDCSNNDEMPVANQVCVNGPTVPTFVEKLVRDSHAGAGLVPGHSARTEDLDEREELTR